MITEKTHTEEWFKSIKNTFKKKDPSILERVIKALTLLEQLKLSGLHSFVFKGGTSLILLLKNINRFSVDIDLCVKEKPENLNEIFNKVVNMGVFTKWEVTPRKPRPPLQKEHYKFIFNSLHSGKDSHIFLDLVFQELHYPKIDKKFIQAAYIETDGSLTEVDVLPIGCMLGDKLTAFAPNTCGIPYGIEKELEILKQLYDVSNLFGECDDLSLVKETFNKSSEVELAYRGLKEKTPHDVLDDIFETSILIATRGKNGNSEHYKEIEKGISGFKHYVAVGSFTIDNAIVCASQALYLSRLLKADATELKKFNPEEDLSTVHIEGEYNYLNKIKKSSPEAFFYLNEAILVHESLTVEEE